MKWPLLLVAGMFGVVGLWFAWEWLQLPGSIGWRAQRSTKREQERLRRAPTSDLVSEARKAIQYEKWERFAAARTLLDQDGWTDDGLVQAIERLYAAVSEDDRANGRSGRDSGAFEFHDCGLASICEALKHRREA